MRIVTDGKYYAVEKGWIFKRYLNLYTNNDWMSLKDSYQFCWGSKERVEEEYNFLLRKKNIRVVKEKNEN